ncbi:MAG: MaoC family dehydratase N-terminal domain-containing protein [Candidatus Hodarchaeota archaeon]
MDDDQIKKNADFLIKNLAGMEVPGSATVNVRYKNLVNFAQVYGITDPKYVGSEEQGIVACHAFANHFTIKALYKLLLGSKLEQDGEMRPFLLNPGKLLHAGQEYDWNGCVDVKPGDKLKVTAKWGKVWVVEKNMVLFAELLVEVKNQNGELVCKPLVTAAVRPGGY